jgi:hypothetical protein
MMLMAPRMMEVFFNETVESQATTNAISSTRYFKALPRRAPSFPAAELVLGSSGKSALETASPGLVTRTVS